MMSQRIRAEPSVTVAIPLHNEQESVEELLRQVTEVLDELPGSDHEIVCVDDGSRDRTLELLVEARAHYPQSRLPIEELWPPGRTLGCLRTLQW